MNVAIMTAATTATAVLAGRGQLARARGLVRRSAAIAAAVRLPDAGHYLTIALDSWFEPENALAGGPKSEGKRILLVDDSPFFRNLLTPLLSVAGYDVTSVEGADKALALCEAGRDFDIIVSDIEMPGMSGFEFAEAVKAGRWQNTPLVALSAHTSAKDLDRGRKAGFVDYIAKLDRDALLAAAKFTDAVNRVVTSVPGRQVATIGRIQALPGAYNVIAGEVILGLDLRDLDAAKIELLYRKIVAEAQQIAEATGTTFQFKEVTTDVPAPTDRRIRQLIAESAKELGLTHDDREGVVQLVGHARQQRAHDEHHDVNSVECDRHARLFQPCFRGATGVSVRAGRAVGWSSGSWDRSRCGTGVANSPLRARSRAPCSPCCCCTQMRSCRPAG